MLSLYEETINITTGGEGDIVNITPYISSAVEKSGVVSGTINIFSEGSTGALTTIEYETGVLEDFKRALSKIAPDDISYAHDAVWGDGNGRSHVKAAFIGPSLTLPVRDCRPLLGVWQQVVFLELDVKPKRERQVFCTVAGITKNTKN
ncbi:MAG: YjbQ family protein [Methanomicrobiaceae archaeon]|nr:YjbQ family protein [Methanomicrobiaceae archaeon]